MLTPNLDSANRTSGVLSTYASSGHYGGGDTETVIRVHLSSGLSNNRKAQIPPMPTPQTGRPVNFQILVRAE